MAMHDRLCKHGNSEDAMHDRRRKHDNHEDGDARPTVYDNGDSMTACANTTTVRMAMHARRCKHDKHEDGDA